MIQLNFVQNRSLNMSILKHLLKGDNYCCTLKGDNYWLHVFQFRKNDNKHMGMKVIYDMVELDCFLY
jgi:hypothetical protein